MWVFACESVFFFFYIDKQIYKKPKEGTKAPSVIQGVYRKELTAKPKEKEAKAKYKTAHKARAKEY